MNQHNLSTYKWLFLFIIILVSFTSFRYYLIDKYEETNNNIYLIITIFIFIILVFFKIL